MATVEPAHAALLGELAAARGESERLRREGEVLREEKRRAEEEKRRAEDEVRRLRTEGDLLREMVRLLRAARFGRSSEKSAGLQGELLLGEEDLSFEEVEAEAAAGGAPVGAEQVLGEERRPRRYRRKHPGRAPLPAHLERVEEVVEVPAGERCCGKCGCAMEAVGHECAEVLDVVPARLVVRVVKREVLACRNRACEGGSAATAPPPPRAFPKAKASDRFIAGLAVSKYADHQPVYRQAAALARERVGLSRKTLCGYLGELAGLLRAVWLAMCQEVRAAAVVQADETRVRVLGGGKGAGAYTGWFWQYSVPGGTLVYDFQPTRGRDGPEAFLAGFRNTLQCDALGSYDGAGGEGMKRGGCMAHSRRRFTDALKAGDGRAAGAVDKFGFLYTVEAVAREAELGPGERQALRESYSRACFAQLEAEVVGLRAQALPKSALGKACDYFLGQRERLALFLEDGALEIDNNLCENGMRPLALGRKNWMFVGSEQAGENAARIASVMETCRRLGLNPQEYLEDLLAQTARGFPANRMAELTPARWKAAREKNRGPAAPVHLS